MSRTFAVGSLTLVGVWLALGVPAAGQVLVGGVPNGNYTPLHAWYDVDQSTGVWEGRTDQYDDEFLVDVRDTGTGSGAHRGTSYGTNVETWAQFDDTGTPGSNWPARVGGLTGTQNGMTTWEVRNAAGWDDAEGWTDDDGVGTDGIGLGGTYTFFMVMNIHTAERWHGGWDQNPDGPLEDAPILNGSTSAFDQDPTTGSEPGKALLWLDANRDGANGAQWVLDAGTELVTGPVTFNEWQVHTFVISDFDNSFLSRHYVNGVLLGEGEAGSNELASPQFWASGGGWHRAADLDFAEGIFYDETIEGDDRIGIEQYLLNKWVATAESADFDEDGDVDGDDFLLWQTGFGIASGATKMDGDYDDDGDVDGDDFLGWQDQFGSGSGAAGAAIPEPASALLCIAAVLGLAAWRRR